jgi:hypothetical protein
MSYPVRQAFTGLCSLVALSLSLAPALANSAVPTETATASSAQWPSNSAMQSGMNAIREALAKEKANIDANRLSGPDYVKLAELIDGRINAMLQSKIEPDALQKAFSTVVIVDMQWGISMMRDSPKLEVKRVGTLGVMRALGNYGKHFQHPNWRDL